MGVSQNPQDDTSLLSQELRQLLRRAYPSWDIRDTTAHERLASTFDSARVVQGIEDDLRELRSRLYGADVPVHQLRWTIGVAEPQGDGRSRAIFLIVPVRSALSLSASERPSPTAPSDRHPSVPWMRLRVSVLGPYAEWTWFQGRAIPPEGERIELEQALHEMLKARGVRLLDAYALRIRLSGMVGHRYGLRRETPTVEQALFGAVDIHGRPAPP